MNDQPKQPAPPLVSGLRVHPYAWTYLMESNREPPEHDPAITVGVHAEDLPADWRASRWERQGPDGSVATMSRVSQAIDLAVHQVRSAMHLAGFTEDDVRRFTQPFGATTTALHAVGALWEFRRYGVAPGEATAWAHAGLEPWLARIYIDAGRDAYFAAGLERFLSKNMTATAVMPWGEYLARVRLVVLDHRIGRGRARDYVLAGVAHHEIREWEARRRGGEDIDSIVATLAALRT